MLRAVSQAGWVRIQYSQRRRDVVDDLEDIVPGYVRRDENETIVFKMRRIEIVRLDDMHILTLWTDCCIRSA